MERSLTLAGHPWRRLWSFLAGAGMITSAVLTIQHFFLANFPESIFAGSFCDISAFLNCDSSAYSSIAHFWGVPMGYFGLFVGALVALGALFPSASFERTNKSISLLNAFGVLGLLFYSMFFLKSLCLLCASYYIFSLFSFFLFWKYGLRAEGSGLLRRIIPFLVPSFKYLAVSAVVLTAGAYGFHLFYGAKRDAQLGGVSLNIVKEFYSLAQVPNPSLISPYWVAKSTEHFEDAPIRIIEYVDFLCPDCLFLYRQLKLLKNEYKGKINIAFQFFPLDSQCNEVVEKNLHPGACDLSFMAAHDPAKFNAIHDEIFENFVKARNPEWRAQLAKKYGVEAALQDSVTQELVHRIINTGAEYEKTSDRYAHGIRSTPTMIINNRMVIGTLPYPHLKAIFESLLTEAKEPGSRRFFEHWVQFRPGKKPKGTS
ncbi:MAG: vitamin K epoxide reductase family protein [Clostridiales bacterium]|nr:vitamin K epoxide reductase family protein [Clostridiales bacterium]